MAPVLLIIVIIIVFEIIRRFIAQKSWEKEKQHIITINKLVEKERNELNIPPDNIKLEVKRLIDEGNKFSRKQKSDKAIFSYTKAIELDQNDSEAYYRRGSEYMYVYIFTENSKSYWDNPKKYLQLAIEDYTRAIELNPHDFKSYNCRAFLFLKSQRYQEAIKDDTKAIELNSLYEDAFWTRGQAYEALGKTQQAFSDIKEAAKLGYEPAQKYLKKKRISN